MAHIHIPADIPVKYLDRDGSWKMLFGSMFVVGLAAFLYTLSNDPDRAWQAYVSNWLFFTSVECSQLTGQATFHLSTRTRALSLVVFVGTGRYTLSCRTMSVTF